MAPVLFAHPCAFVHLSHGELFFLTVLCFRTFQHPWYEDIELESVLLRASCCCRPDSPLGRGLLRCEIDRARHQEEGTSLRDEAALTVW